MTWLGLALESSSCSWLARVIHSRLIGIMNHYYSVSLWLFIALKWARGDPKPQHFSYCTTFIFPCLHCLLFVIALHYCLSYFTPLHHTLSHTHTLHSFHFSPFHLARALTTHTLPRDWGALDRRRK